MKNIGIALATFYVASIETLKDLGIYEDYKVECQKGLKEIAETDEDIAKAVAEDLERETERYIMSRASIAVLNNEPQRFILSAFNFETSIKGSDYWVEMTYKFCLNHPMVG